MHFYSYQSTIVRWKHRTVAPEIYHGGRGAKKISIFCFPPPLVVQSRHRSVLQLVPVDKPAMEAKRFQLHCGVRTTIVASFLSNTLSLLTHVEAREKRV